MKYLILTLFVLLSSSFAGAATVNIEVHLKKNISNKEKSKLIVAEAEKLLHPALLIHAHHVLKKAVELDSSNFKAQFYYKFLNIYIPLQGLGYRIKPFAAQLPWKAQEELKTALQGPNKSEVDFWNKKIGQPITSESDLQKDLSGLLKRLSNFRSYISKNLEQKTSLNLYYYTTSMDLITPNWTQCIATANQNNTIFKINHCGSTKKSTINIAAPDLVAIQLSASAFQIILIYSTSYNIDGLLKMIDRMENTNLTAKQFYSDLGKQKQFGILKKNNQLDVVPKLSADFRSTLSWVEKNHNFLCKKRNGFLISDTCISQGNSAGLQKMFSKQGVEIKSHVPTRDPETGQYTNTEPFSSRLSLVGPGYAKVTDLKNIFPSDDSFDKCGNVIKLNDPTFAGLYPDGSYLELQKITSQYQAKRTSFYFRECL